MKQFYFFIVKSLILAIGFLVIINSYAATEYLFKPKAENKSLLATNLFKGKEISTIKSIGVFKAKFTENEVAKLKDQMEYIEPNLIYHAYDLEPSIPATQWGLPKIDAEKAWKITTGKKNVIVAVIDTGVDYNHVALKKNMWVNKKEIPGNLKDDDGNGYIDDVHGYDFANGDPDPFDDHMHGTHCAGIIAANNNQAMGIAPNVTIMPVKFLTGSGSGTLEAAIKSIEYAVNNGAQVLSNSWGGGGYSEALKEIIVYAKNKGVLFVAAAGNESNDNDTNPSFPASYQEENIISVGASTQEDKAAYFSNFGKYSVHLFAPGYGIYSTIPNNQYKSLSGTSMACPYVSGAAALVLSQDSSCKFQCMKDKIMSGAQPKEAFTETSVTGGLLNAFSSLSN